MKKTTQPTSILAPIYVYKIDTKLTMLISSDKNEIISYCIDNSKKAPEKKLSKQESLENALNGYKGYGFYKDFFVSRNKLKLSDFWNTKKQNEHFNNYITKEYDFILKHVASVTFKQLGEFDYDVFIKTIEYAMSKLKEPKGINNVLELLVCKYRFLMLDKKRDLKLKRDVIDNSEFYDEDMFLETNDVSDNYSIKEDNAYVMKQSMKDDIIKEYINSISKTKKQAKNQLLIFNYFMVNTELINKIYSGENVKRLNIPQELKSNTYLIEQSKAQKVSVTTYIVNLCSNVVKHLKENINILREDFNNLIDYVAEDDFDELTLNDFINNKTK
jgi:hypothetical protein